MIRPLCPSVKRQFINMQHHKKAKVLEFATTSATTASSSRRQQQWRPMLSCPFSRCSCLIWLFGFYPFSSRGHPSPLSCMHILKLCFLYPVIPHCFPGSVSFKFSLFDVQTGSVWTGPVGGLASSTTTLRGAPFVHFFFSLLIFLVVVVLRLLYAQLNFPSFGSGYCN